MELTREAKSSTESARGKEQTSSRLVLFDFDGTITTRDTLIEFVMFYRGRQKYFRGMLRLAPMLALFALKLIPNWKAKQFFLTHFFKDEPLEHFDAKCRQFSTQVLPGLIRPGALKEIEEYRRQGATMAIVSASAENWVRPWAESQGMQCLATKLEAKDGKLTGNLEGRNCYGDQKACRINDAFDLSRFEEVIAYGDSRGDKEMLALAGKRYYKPFR